MNGAVVKKTQDTLGKVIKKPPLTEKLLSKPPFRYLHDIFSEVRCLAGYCTCLYYTRQPSRLALVSVICMYIVCGPLLDFS